MHDGSRVKGDDVPILKLYQKLPFREANMIILTYTVRARVRIRVSEKLGGT